MNLAAPQEIKLSDYSAPAYKTQAVELEFDINEGATTVRSTLHVERVQSEGSELYLDGEELTLEAVQVDGRPLADNEYQVTAEGMTLFGLSEAHEITITTTIHPEQNTALEGLYRSSKMYCTQCEAQGFRKIT
ncbi:MAG: aminopeptidase N, partial [Pseudomonadales bacterium]